MVLLIVPLSVLLESMLVLLVLKVYAQLSLLVGLLMKKLVVLRFEVPHLMVRRELAGVQWPVLLALLPMAHLLLCPLGDGCNSDADAVYTPTDASEGIG